MTQSRPHSPVTAARASHRPRWCLCFAAVFAPLILAASPDAVRGQDRPLPDVQTLLQAIRGHLQTDALRQSRYVFVETRRDITRDPATGRVVSETVNVFESYPGLPDRPRWKRQIVKNGHALTAAALADQDRERQRYVLKYAARMERASQADRASQTRQREKERRESDESIEEALRVYSFRVMGREGLEGRDTIALAFSPKPGVAPRTRDGKLLTKFAGTAWISEADFEVARLAIEAIDTVSIGLGMVARIHKGSRLVFDRRKVNDEEWLPAAASYSVSARLLLLKKVRTDAVVEFSDYRKFSVLTETTVRAKDER